MKFKQTISSMIASAFLIAAVHVYAQEQDKTSAAGTYDSGIEEKIEGRLFVGTTAFMIVNAIPGVKNPPDLFSA